MLQKILFYSIPFFPFENFWIFSIFHQGFGYGIHLQNSPTKRKLGNPYLEKISK